VLPLDSDEGPGHGVRVHDSGHAHRRYKNQLKEFKTNQKQQKSANFQSGHAVTKGAKRFDPTVKKIGEKGRNLLLLYI